MQYSLVATTLMVRLGDTPPLVAHLGTALQSAMLVAHLARPAYRLEEFIAGYQGQHATHSSGPSPG